MSESMSTSESTKGSGSSVRKDKNRVERGLPMPKMSVWGLVFSIPHCMIAVTFILMMIAVGLNGSGIHDFSMYEAFIMLFGLISAITFPLSLIFSIIGISSMDRQKQSVKKAWVAILISGAPLIFKLVMGIIYIPFMILR